MRPIEKTTRPATTAGPFQAILLFSTSASVLTYEILLMRLFSIGQWHHFVYMVISMALLGYGAAGSILFITFDRIRGQLETWLVCLAGATAVSFPLAFSLSQRVGLDPLQLVWQPAEWWSMLLTYLLMAIPFVLAGAIVGIVLTASGEQAHRMYAVDLMGAGCGVLVIVPALFLSPPRTLLLGSGCLVLAGTLCGCLTWGGRHKAGGRLRFAAFTTLIAASLLTLSYIKLPPTPRIHETKALPMTLSFPDARIETTTMGPMGMVQVVGSRLIRHAPGLSLNFGLDDMGANLPEQKAIFLDADGLSPIARFSGNLEELAYLDFTTTALPYHVRHPAGVLVIGSGGGSDVLLGLKHGARDIVALEANKQIAGLLLGPYAEFSGHLYSLPEVRLQTREARQFLHTTNAKFDLINISLLDSPVTSAGGLHSATESFLYTTEAFQLYLSRLKDSGILSITRWLKLPPRDSLRIIATALDALRKMRLGGAPEAHLLFIRSWKTATILVSKSPFSPEEIDRALKFCDDRSFDPAYYAGMPLARANRYDILASPHYFNGAVALTGPDAPFFLDNYVFDVSAISDDRPYFSHFFRWDKAPALFKQLRREWLPMIELGYVFILATLVQAVLAGGVLILLPLVIHRWLNRPSRNAGQSLDFMTMLQTLLYFGVVGMAFMFLEMALLPKYTLLLAHPVYSAAVVLSTLLVFAGVGSISVRRFQDRGIRFLWISVGVIFLWVGFHTVIGDHLFSLAMGWPFWGRLGLAVLFISVLAFFLGWPFPSGLRVMARKFPGLLPWAWGTNGCASVIGAVFGKCLAVSIGFRALMLAACGLYLLALVIFHRGFRD